ncbi:MAG: hypothetical protein K1X72_13155 [Pyrinomonadaceae bacterium]|nr:hypothetical protein [Pyrinomonadaceae bacterium]
MKKYFAIFAIVLFVTFAKAQTAGEALEVAKATLKAHGGEKLAQIKNLALKGTADVTVPGTTITMPAGFAMVTSGEKYRLDIQAPGLNFSQISDGVNTTSSMGGGAVVPPLNRVGLYLLPRIAEEGYVVTALSDKFKKKKGFRITSPEGFYSDFIVDEKTSRVKEYESSYDVGGRTISTAVSIEKYREVDGMLINEKFSQRIDLGQASAYANFNAKDISVNSEVSADLFTIKQ